MGLLEPRDVLLLDELDELRDRDRDADLLDVLPDGDGVREPDRDFVFFLLICASLDVRRSTGSTTTTGELFMFMLT